MQMDEILSEVRSLRQPQHNEPYGTQIAPTQDYPRPAVGEAVYCGGPSHNPTFRCPVVMVDGAKTFGPEAHSKQLAKFLAQQMITDKPTFYKPLPLNPAQMTVCCAICVVFSMLTPKTNPEMFQDGPYQDLGDYSVDKWGNIRNHYFKPEEYASYNPYGLYRSIRDTLDNNTRHERFLEAKKFKEQQLEQFLLDKQQKKNFKKDLTQEGVEPNPGPGKGKSTRKQQKKYVKKAEKQIEKAINTQMKTKMQVKPVVVAVPQKNKRMHIKSGDKMVNVTDGLNNGKIIHHRSIIDHFAPRSEKIMDILPSVSFAVRLSAPVNPGNSGICPIFSQQAVVYEMFKRGRAGVHFIYRTEAYTASGTNTTAGLVLMMWNPDVDDPDPVSASEMENYETCVSGPPFARKLVLTIRNTSPFRKHYVYQSSNVPAPLTNLGKFYDDGRIVVAVANTPGTTALGELYITYSFDMYITKNPSTVVSYGVAHILEFPANTAAIAGSAFLGTGGGTVGTGATLPVVTTINSFTLPSVGDYIVNAIWTAAGSITGTPAFSAGANIFGVTNAFQDFSVGFLTGVSTTRSTISQYYRVTSAGNGSANKVTISNINGLASGTCDIYITPWSPFISLNYIAPKRNPLSINQEDEFNVMKSKLETIYQKLLKRDVDHDADEKDSHYSESDVDYVEDIPSSRGTRRILSRAPLKKDLTRYGVEPNPGPGENSLMDIDSEPPPSAPLLCKGGLELSIEVEQYCWSTEFDIKELPTSIVEIVCQYMIHDAPYITLEQFARYVSNYFIECSAGAEKTRVVHSTHNRSVECEGCQYLPQVPLLHGMNCNRAVLYEDKRISAECSDNIQCEDCDTEHYAGICGCLHDCPCTGILWFHDHRYPSLPSLCSLTPKYIEFFDTMDFNIAARNHTTLVKYVEDQCCDKYSYFTRHIRNYYNQLDAFRFYEPHPKDLTDYGIEPNPGPSVEDSLQSRFEALSPTVVYEQSDDVLSSPSISFKKVLERCSACGKVMYWNTKYQRYACKDCQKFLTWKKKPKIEVQSAPVSPVSSKDIEYSQEPAKKKKRSNSANREYFVVNAKGRFKHAKLRAKHLYEKAVVESKTWKKKEPEPKVTVQIRPPVFHDDPNQDQIPRIHAESLVDESAKLKQVVSAKDEFENIKYADLLQNLMGIKFPEPLIHHPATRDKWFLENNENRKFVPKLKDYEINMDEFARYPMALVNSEKVSPLIIARPYTGTIIISLPATLVDELSAYFSMHSNIDEKVYEISMSVARKLVRNITGVDPSVQTNSILYGPYLAWKEVNILRQLINPFSKLPYRTVGDFTQLGIIDDSNYKATELISKDRALEDRVNPGVSFENYEMKCLPKFGRTIRLWWRRMFRKKIVVPGLQLDQQAALAIADMDVQQRKENIINNKFPNYAPIHSYNKEVYFNPFFGEHFRLQLNGTHGEYTRSDDVLMYKHETIDMEVPKQKENAGFWYPLYDKFTHKKFDTNQVSQAAYWWNHSYRPVCYSNNVINEKSTIATRVTVETPIVDEKFLDEMIAWSKQNFSTIINRKWKVIKPVSWVSYKDRSNATTQMKIKLEEALTDMKMMGYEQDDDISEKLAWYWTTRKLFLKKENLPYRTPMGKKYKSARAIQGLLNLFYLVVLGPWFMALQDHFKTIWDKDNWVCFTSGVDAVDAASVLNEMWTIIEDDVSTFDSSVHEKLGIFEVWIAKRFGASEAILKLMTANNSTHGVTMLGGKYWMPGGRKSGDPFTTLFNSLLNVFLHAFILHKHFGWKVKEIKARVRMLVAGDDNLMTINAPPIDFVPYMAKLGFKSEAIVRPTLDEAEFCSCRLYCINGTWVFGPIPGKVLSKLGYINAPPKDVSRESMMKGIAIGLTRVCCFIPPIAAVAKRILELTEDKVAYLGYSTRFKQEFWHMHFDYTAFDSQFNPDIYASLYMTYGWTYNMQLLLERELSTMDFDYNVPNNSVLNILFDRDTAGPAVVAA